MQFTVISSHRAAHQLQHQEAMAEGLRAHGIEPVLTTACSARTKFVACWGWRLGKALREQGHEVAVMERGFLSDRFSWTSLAWNGLNGRGEFPVPPDDNGDRFCTHHSFKPWRKTDGEYVLLMGQVPGDASLQGRNLLPWYEETARQATKAYGLPVVFRPHPLAERKGFRQNVPYTKRSSRELAQDLERAHVVITYNSNSAVDAVIAGVPAVAVDPGSMAWPVAGHAVGDRIMPNTSEWMRDLAWKQWQLDEISSGVALTALLEMKNVGNGAV